MQLLDFILHIDVYLANIIDLFGPVTYVVLFIIIFVETGLVITPFLPGDSLIFAAGTFSGSDFLNVWTVYFVILGAAIMGDTANYWIGYSLGPKIFFKEHSILFNKAYLEKTRTFYERHGAKTIVLARFVPMVRTFAPFVAGTGKMHYRTFLVYNIVGAFLWVTLFTFVGYFFGSLPFVKENFEYVIFGIIVLSFIPMGIEYLKTRSK